jgi:hypothetical protein
MHLSEYPRSLRCNFVGNCIRGIIDEPAKSAHRRYQKRYAVKATDDGKFQVVSQYEQGVFLHLPFS